MKKAISLLLMFTLILGLSACGAPAKAGGQYAVMYSADQYVIGVNYTGLDMEGLRLANLAYGSEGYGSGEASAAGGCSITFATYMNGKTGAVRNMDLQISNYCAYELNVQPGDNVKYPMWALCYIGTDEKSYDEMLNTSMSDTQYARIPFTATDTMSFGLDAQGRKASLYCAVLMRSSETDDEGNYIWTCSGTCPGAPIRCCTQSVPTLLAAQCVTISDALAYVGAVDEKYKRLYPDVDPTLDVYTLNIENETMSNHWFEVVALEDSTGRHGVLEFIDNYAIWHEDIDYCFNFFLQDEYLHNPDGTYREKNGAGIGRYQAVVPYLNEVLTVEDHVALMDGIRYSFMTYYSEYGDYVGYDWRNNPVDWRSEYTHYDTWHAYDTFKTKGFDTRLADALYPLWANYLNTETGEIERVDDYEYWRRNQDHLQAVYTMNYVLAEENKEEMMNLVRWCGSFYNSLSWKDIRDTNSGWETYFRVVADPMGNRVTRWFNEDITTADTIVWTTMYPQD